jgi:hypothetical protein
VAAGVAVACLVTALIITAGRPGTSSRPRASAASAASAAPAAPAAPSARVRWINDRYGGNLAAAGGTVYVGGSGTVSALAAGS